MKSIFHSFERQERGPSKRHGVAGAGAPGHSRETLIEPVPLSSSGGKCVQVTHSYDVAVCPVTHL